MYLDRVILDVLVALEAFYFVGLLVQRSVEDFQCLHKCIFGAAVRYRRVIIYSLDALVG